MPVCHHVLENRDADGIAGVNKDTEQDEDSDLHGYQCSDGSQRTERCENHHRLFDVRLLDDPDTELMFAIKDTKPTPALMIPL